MEQADDAVTDEGETLLVRHSDVGSQSQVYDEELCAHGQGRL